MRKDEESFAISQNGNALIRVLFNGKIEGELMT